MEDHALLISLAVIGVATAGSGLALLGRRRARLAGVLLVVVGLALAMVVGLARADRDHQARELLLVTSLLGVPACLMAYPVLRWRRVDEVAWLVVVLGLELAAVLWWGGTDGAATLAILGGCGLLGHIWWRIETSAEKERRALQWMALAAATTGLLAAVADFAVENGAGVPYAFAVLALVGPAMVVGVALPEIVDVRGVTVTSVVVTVCVIAVTTLFVGAVALLDMAGVDDPSSGTLGLVAGLSAIAFHPLQVVLRGTVDEALFGGRRDPLDAASRVAGGVGDDPVAALRAIREALVLPYAALTTPAGELAASGTSSTHTRSFPLDGAGAQLVVGLRPGDLALSSSDQHVLRLAAPLLAQTLRARALATDLQESREATITAREEERRRLRRDLHDGLGPRLSGIAFTSDAARNLVRTDPEAADALLKQLRADTTTAIEDIRRLVYAMRPPALDELGLVPALRQQATGLPLRVELAVPPALPPLSAAVEVAAYRIVVEALANAVRHSSATMVTVMIRVEPDGLAVEVTDDGAAGGPWTMGVGTASMHERAAELGGTLGAGPTPAGGRVAALLPLGTSA
jgi:two-component system NarL family sensor kinase